jgi:hypothetical protein
MERAVLVAIDESPVPRSAGIQRLPECLEVRRRVRFGAQEIDVAPEDLRRTVTRHRTERLVDELDATGGVGDQDGLAGGRDGGPEQGETFIGEPALVCGEARLGHVGRPTKDVCEHTEQEKRLPLC